MSATERMPWELMIDESHDVFTPDDSVDDSFIGDEYMGEQRDHLSFVSGESLDTHGETATADPDLIKKERRRNGAKAYEDKVTDILKMGVTMTVGRPSTVVDGAALLLHGEQVAYTFGDLAVVDPHTATVINFLHGGTGNPATAAVMAALPLVLQILRNHEPEIENITRINLPFTKGRIGFKIPSRMKLRFSNNIVVAGMTNDPSDVYRAAFTPNVVEDIKQNLKVTVANYKPRHRSP